MERLSERCGDYIRIKGCSALYANEERKGAYLNNAVVRFADYEDTGMEPEQITAAQKAMRAGLALACALQAYRALGTVEELTALIKARGEGRVIDETTALAMAAGARAIENNKRLFGVTYGWDIFGECGGPKEISYFEAAKRLRAISESVLTQTEAEAALSGGDRDGTK